MYDIVCMFFICVDYYVVWVFKVIDCGIFLKKFWVWDNSEISVGVCFMDDVFDFVVGVDWDCWFGYNYCVIVYDFGDFFSCSIDKW